MRVHVVYAHPSEVSFTAEVKNQFLASLEELGHQYTFSDLYAMGFSSDMSEQEYQREAFYQTDRLLAEEVLREQEYVNAAEALVLIYPVFWTEAPAKLVGWFDRVWTFGFAYGDDLHPATMKQLSKALVICIAGHTEEELAEQGRLQSMRNVMLDDRIFDRAREKDLVVLGGTSRDNMARRNRVRSAHLAKVDNLAATL